jgi:hypothetical protein
VSILGGSRSSAPSARRESGPCRAALTRLAELDDLALRDGPADADDRGAAVDVAALEHRPFLGPQAGRCSEGGQRLVAGRELGADRVDLGERVGADRPGRRLPVRADQLGRVAGHVVPAHGGAERLPERADDPVAGPLRQLRPPAGELVNHALELAERDVAVGARRIAEPLAQRIDRALAGAGGVALEVELGELGERQVARGPGLAPQARLDRVAVVSESGGAGRERASRLALALVVVVAKLVATARKLADAPALHRGI